jgi:hypothetical protein
MNPDPVAKLAKFTPAAPTDAAELLFAAGRASARTHWLWKVAVSALAVSNVAMGVLFALRPTDAPAPVPEPIRVPVTQPAPEPPAVQVPPSSDAVDDPWSYRALRATDLEHAPRAETYPTPAPRESLTALSGRRGELD